MIVLVDEESRPTAGLLFVVPGTVDVFPLARRSAKERSGVTLLTSK